MNDKTKKPVTEQRWDGKIVDGDLQQLQESSAKVMGLVKEAGEGDPAKKAWSAIKKAINAALPKIIKNAVPEFKAADAEYFSFLYDEIEDRMGSPIVRVSINKDTIQGMLDQIEASDGGGESGDKKARRSGRVVKESKIDKELDLISDWLDETYPYFEFEGEDYPSYNEDWTWDGEVLTVTVCTNPNADPTGEDNPDDWKTKTFTRSNLQGLGVLKSDNKVKAKFGKKA